MTAWIVLPVYVIGWVATARIFAAGDAPVPAVDRAAMGFLALLWPAMLAVLVAGSILALPTMRWRKISQLGESAGLAFAKETAGITRKKPR